MSHASLAQPIVAAQPAARRWLDLAEQLDRCARLLRQQAADWAARHRLTEAQFSLLWPCLDAPAEGISQSDLTATLVVSPAHVSGTVEQLRAKGLLLGQRDPLDRRRQRWRLTAAGRELLKSAVADLTDWALELESRMGGGSSEGLAQGLARLNQTLRLRCVTGPGEGGDP